MQKPSMSSGGSCDQVGFGTSTTLDAISYYVLCPSSQEAWVSEQPLPGSTATISYSQISACWPKQQLIHFHHFTYENFFSCIPNVMTIIHLSWGRSRVCEAKSILLPILKTTKHLQICSHFGIADMGSQARTKGLLLWFLTTFCPLKQTPLESRNSSPAEIPQSFLNVDAILQLPILFSSGKRGENSMFSDCLLPWNLA